jgi:hypothetical protein
VVDTTIPPATEPPNNAEPLNDDETNRGLSWQIPVFIALAGGGVAVAMAVMVSIKKKK